VLEEAELGLVLDDLDFGGKEVVAVGASAAEELVGLGDVERVEDRLGELDVSEMTGAGERVEAAGGAAGSDKGGRG
jgi:hypothetical protein